MRKWKMQQRNEEAVDLWLYGEVSEGYYDWWGDYCGGENSALGIRDELAKYPNATQINVYINSVGGDVMEGTAIYNILKRHRANKTVYIDGFACSVASVIAMAGDKVIMPKNTMMMIHNCWTYAIGNAKELRKIADDLEQIMVANRQAYLSKTNGKITEEQLIAFLDEEKYLTAEECIKYGFADEFAKEEADEAKMNQMLKQSNEDLKFHLSRNKTLKELLKETALPNKDDSIDPEKQETLKDLLEEQKTLLFLFSNIGGKKNEK